jgi:peroxiredoxin
MYISSFKFNSSNIFKSKRLEVVGIAADRNLETTRSYLEKTKLPWQNIFISLLQVWDQESLSGQFWVRSFPSYFLINQKGNIIAREKNIQAIKEKIEPIFEENK